MNLNILFLGTLAISFFDGTSAQTQDRFAGMECTEGFCQGPGRTHQQVVSYCIGENFETAIESNFCRNSEDGFEYKCCRRVGFFGQSPIENEIDGNSQNQPFLFPQGPQQWPQQWQQGPQQWPQQWQQQRQQRQQWPQQWQQGPQQWPQQWQQRQQGPQQWPLTRSQPPQRIPSNNMRPFGNPQLPRPFSK